jgi:hypothetical protein
MSAVGEAENAEFDSVAADAAVSVATGAAATTTTTAVNLPSDEPMADGADVDDFGFDFMGDSAEDEDLSFDELFEEAPEGEDIEETIEAPKGKTPDSEAAGGDDFSFDLPDAEAELEDDFGFDPADDKDFSFDDDDPASVSESGDSGTEEGPTRPFDLPESPQSVWAPAADQRTFEDSPAIFPPVEEIDTDSEANIAPLASEDTEEIYILEEAEVVSLTPTFEDQCELEVPQGETVLESSVLLLTPQDNLVNEVSPVIAAVRSAEIVTSPALPRPPLASCVGAFIFDVALLAVVGFSFVVTIV